MVRRLIASLVLVACLLGTVQPALACAHAASRTDCCPTGSSGERLRPTAPSIEAYGCCAQPAAVTPSVSVVRARTVQGHASTSPGAVDLTWVAVGQHVAAVRTPPALISYHVDESLTYLRTARLRL